MTPAGTDAAPTAEAAESLEPTPSEPTPSEPTSSESTSSEQTSSGAVHISDFETVAYCKKPAAHF